jgi:hypothetical protein
MVWFFVSHAAKSAANFAPAAAWALHAYKQIHTIYSVGRQLKNLLLGVRFKLRNLPLQCGGPLILGFAFSRNSTGNGALHLRAIHGDQRFELVAVRCFTDRTRSLEGASMLRKKLHHRAMLLVLLLFCAYLKPMTLVTKLCNRIAVKT